MKKILITSAFISLVFMHVFAQKLIEGIVTNSNGETMPGVSIVIKGTTQGSVTDLDGKYQIENVADDATLVYSSIGMTTQEIRVGEKTKINVVLKEDNVSLDAVVVVGYGTQTKQNLTGSVAKLSSDKIVQRPVSTVENALQGQVSGVQVTSTGGPGSAPTVRIRGVGSVNFDADPLYVIDGVPVGNLNNFDVKDIESVSVLKDAASAAIYGSRAANGVVIITTKKGTVGNKMSLNIDASYGFQKAWNKLDLLNSEEYTQYAAELLNNAKLKLPPRLNNLDQPIYEGATQTYAQTETDWQDEIFQVAPMSQLNVNFSGGTEKSRIYTSYSKYDQEGIMIGTGYSRHSFRMNTENRLNDHIIFGENIKVSYSETQNEKVSGARTIAKHAINHIPYLPVYNPNALSGYGGAEKADGSDPENPLRIALLHKNETRMVNVMGNTFAQVKLAKWLTFRSSVGLDYTVERNIIQLPEFEEEFNKDGYHSRTENQITDDRFTYFSPTFTNQLTFDKTFDKHSLNAVGFIENQTTHYNTLQADAKHSTNDLDKMEGSYDAVLAGRYDKTALISYAGRINYAYDQKYLINASLRRDGSSVFAPGKKWGNFPGASVGWIVSKESFMDNMDKISNLKLYASYGTLGFNGLDAYPWLSTVSSDTKYPFNNDLSKNVGAYFNEMTNRELEWEITKMSNFGFDLALFNNSVSFSAEYFIRQTDNLIIDNPLAPSLGYSQLPATNIGAMKNWGYEFNAGYTKKVNDLTFSIEGNITFIRNEVLKLSSSQPAINIGAETGDYGGYDITRTEAGQPIQSFYGWEVEGIFQTQEEIDKLNPDTTKAVYYQTKATAPGDIKFKDLNEDGIVDEKDRTNIGHYMPDFSYGLNLSTSYKGFSASLFIQGVQGNEIYNGQKVLTQGMMRLFNADKDVLNAWTPENTNTDIPRAISGDPNANARTSDRFIEDGSYMRIKNLSFSYDLPANFIQSKTKNAIAGARVYVTAQNLLTLTKYSGWDPEIGSSKAYSDSRATLLQGVDFGFYPQPRTFIFGINMSF